MQLQKVANAVHTGRGSLLVARCSSASLGAGAGGGSSRRASRSSRQQQPPTAPTGIFQLYPNANVSMDDIRDAVEACEVCNNREQRKRCFESFGLNSAMVDAYYPIVVDMEHKLDQDDDTGRKVAGFIGTMFFMLVTHKLL